MKNSKRNNSLDHRFEDNMTKEASEIVKKHIKIEDAFEDVYEEGAASMREEFKAMSDDEAFDSANDDIEGWAFDGAKACVLRCIAAGADSDSMGTALWAALDNRSELASYEKSSHTDEDDIFEGHLPIAELILDLWVAGEACLTREELERFIDSSISKGDKKLTKMLEKYYKLKFKYSYLEEKEKEKQQEMQEKENDQAEKEEDELYMQERREDMLDRDHELFG